MDQIVLILLDGSWRYVNTRINSNGLQVLCATKEPSSSSWNVVRYPTGVAITMERENEKIVLNPLYNNSSNSLVVIPEGNNNEVAITSAHMTQGVSEGTVGWQIESPAFLENIRPTVGTDIGLSPLSPQLPAAMLVHYSGSDPQIGQKGDLVLTTRSPVSQIPTDVKQVISYDRYGRAYDYNTGRPLQITKPGGSGGGGSGEQPVVTPNQPSSFSWWYVVIFSVIIIAIIILIYFIFRKKPQENDLTPLMLYYLLQKR